MIIRKNSNMKKVMKYIAIFLFCLTGVNINAQVGIGNATPNSGSILDLTNSNDRALLLPVASTTPSSITTFDSTGMIIYYQNMIYLKTSTGIQALSPWYFDGTNANGITSPATTTIGIATTPNASVNLLIGGTADVTVIGSNAIMGIGNISAQHLMFDADEIMSKSNATTGGVLKLQEDGGTVSIRSGAAVTSNTVLTVNGSINAAGSGKILQNGLDLLPVGTIVMWNGSVNAAGNPLMGVTPNTNWKICDGTGGTPDLRERFVVGAGGDNATVSGGGYTLGNTGGEVTHALTTAELPSHNHTGTTNAGGAHTHDVGSIPNGGEGYVGAYNGSNEVFKWGQTGSVTSTSNGSHTHTFSTGNTGSGTAHENRPPYYALIYIMKI